MTTINARDFGAVGNNFASWCQATAGDPTVSFAWGVPAGLTVGSGVGLKLAAATGSVSGRYFPTPTLRARVTAISGTMVTLDRAPEKSTGGSYFDVVCDDSLPIQAAIDSLGATGGVVVLPEGTYTLGSPKAANNVPIFLPSNVTLRGAGVEKTVLKVCDDACQIPLALGYRAAHIWGPSLIDAGYQYPHASAIVNAHHTMWHGNADWDPAHLDTDPLLVTDHDIAVEDLTIDCNWNKNLANYVPGNTTDRRVRDGRSTPLVASVSSSGGSLVSERDYSFFLTYKDSYGKETAGVKFFATIGAGENAVKLTMPTPPKGAVGQRIYVLDAANDPVDRVRWPYAEWVSDEALKNQWMQPWEVQDFPFQAANGEIVVTSHSPGSVYPPGIGGIGFASACNSNGIFLDNVVRCRIERVKITGCIVDGIGIGYVEQWANQPPHPIHDLIVKDVRISGCSRGALGMTSTDIRRVLFDSVTMSDCYWGLDIEPIGGASGLIENVVFDSCKFSGFWRPSSSGIIIISRDYTPVRNFVVENCIFDDNFTHMSINSNEVTISIKNSRFSNAIWGGISSNACARGSIENCQFIHNGRWLPFPDNIMSQGGWGGILLATPYGNTDDHGFPTWTVRKNVFVSEPTMLIWPLNIQGGSSVVVTDNEFQTMERPGGQEAADVVPPVGVQNVDNPTVMFSGNRGEFRVLKAY